MHNIFYVCTRRKVTADGGNDRQRGDYDPLRVGPPRHPGMSSADPLYAANSAGMILSLIYVHVYYEM